MKYLLLWASVVIRASTMKRRGMSHDSFSSFSQLHYRLLTPSLLLLCLFLKLAIYRMSEV